jgi:hypothetical protein
LQHAGALAWILRGLLQALLDDRFVESQKSYVVSKASAGEREDD